MSELLMGMLDELGPLKDAVDGYRSDWIARGYSETAAEHMALALHAELVKLLFAPAITGAGSKGSQ